MQPASALRNRELVIKAISPASPVGTSGSAADIALWNGNIVNFLFTFSSYIVVNVCFLSLKVSYFYGV